MHAVTLTFEPKMNIFILNDKLERMKPCVATIGFFDGVHRGHRYLIKNVIELAKEMGIESTVVTFDQHPRQVLNTSYKPQLLSSYDEKLLMLSKTGVDNCVVLPFTPTIAQLSARDFMKSILYDRLSVQSLIIGYDNRFGHNRTEGFDDYVRYGESFGMKVIQGQVLQISGVNVSSSVVRSFISEGEVEMAERCLGYPYTLVGTVVGGEQIGRNIGFPTANLKVDNTDKLIPSPGVYAVKVHLEGNISDKYGMMNIGRRPTFNGSTQTLETHILRFSDDIYGKKIGVSFIHRIRSEQKFDTVEALMAQLERDKKTVEEQFYKDSEI